MKLTRAHGLGNVYLVLEQGGPITEQIAIDLCNHATGVGADGVLEPTESTEADFGVRIWNPDGSVAEKSGNGLRIFARWLADRGAGDAFSVFTGTDRVGCVVSGDTVRVQMGHGTVAPQQVPVDWPGPLVDERLPAPAPQRPVVAVGMGNPHCVLFVTEALDTLPWREWGQALETHPAFPNRTNVQVARIVAGAVHIRIWERGAGVTPASGSSACAVAVAAVFTNRLAAGRIEVVAPGGSLFVDVDDELAVQLTGPVEIVGQVTLDERWLNARR